MRFPNLVASFKPLQHRTFLKTFLEKKKSGLSHIQGCLLAFLKLFARKKWCGRLAIFWPFLILKKIVGPVLTKFDQNLLNFMKFKKLFELLWQFYFVNLAFFICPFIFFWNWQPCSHSSSGSIPFGKVADMIIIIG